MAWTGTYEEGRPDTITVEAAALDGRPVFFRILGPWVKPEFAGTSRRPRFIVVSLAILLVVLLVADALCVVLLSLVLYPPFPVSITAIVAWLVLVLGLAMDVWVLRRFGLLALTANLCVIGLLKGAPLAVASWYAALSLTTPLLIAAVAAWSLYVILTSRPGRVSRSAAEPLV